jgi:hypothetical protein
MDGHSAFQTFLADRIEANRREHGSAGLTVADRQQIKGFALGLVASGALKPEEVTPLTADMNSVPLIEGTNITRTTQAIPRKAEPPAQTPLFEKRDGTRPEDTPYGAESQHVPLRVVPVLGRYVDDPPDPTFLSIEVWSTMMAIHIAHPATDRSFAEIINDATPWQGIDDVGTKYHQCGSVISDVLGMIVSTRFLEPGPSPDAQELTLTIGGSGHADRNIQLPLR